jgi:hypothetical protein
MVRATLVERESEKVPVVCAGIFAGAAALKAPIAGAGYPQGICTD